MRPGRLRAFFLAVLLLGTGRLAMGAELYGPDVGVVPFGMGRAYSAVADDWLALHYNPAGLALVKKVDIQLFDVRLESNRDVLQSYQNVSNMGKSSNSLANTMNSFVGKHIMADITNQSQITVPNFAVGLGYDVHADVDLQNAAYPTTFTRYTKDLVLSMGGAVAAGPKKELRLGSAVRVIHRTGGMRYLDIPEIAGSKSTLKEKFTQSGSGMAGDIGMQYRLPNTGRTEVTTSFVWHDIGKTSYGGAMEQNRPTRTDDDMVAGLGVRFPIGGTKNRRLERRYGPTRSSSSLTFAFDYSHLNISPSREQLPKHIHLGTNLDLPILSLQLGLNQTSLTAGMGFDLW
ncbi:MAG: hypothetical protein ACXWQO_09065, partial [Bdellovibrionota bacterium]